MSSQPPIPDSPRVSVIMPTFEQAAFIGRALDSLWAQTFTDWELVIVDDGSCDDTACTLAPWLADVRVRYLRFDSNGGLGRAINAGLHAARGELLAYLPSDDVWYAEHLAQLVACLGHAPGAVLAYAGVRHHYNRSAEGLVPGECLQLVQCLHRRTALRWRQRAELESDDLDRLFWTGLRAQGAFVPAGALSCEWVDHPGQRHKRMREPLGGINPFRQHYRVAGPLHFHTSTGNRIDEQRLYGQLRGTRPRDPRKGRKIVLAGELAYNADRVLALEALGHQLYGLWTPTPSWFNTVGPLPFGRVEELPRHGWREALARIEPDLIYAQLNWQALPFAHEVLMHTPDIPFVWHFKEGPFICIEKGTWPLLADLVRLADGCIYSSPEMRDWFATAVPGLPASCCAPRPEHVLDGDLPRRAWFLQARSPLLSGAGPGAGGQVHTVVPGRPIGLHPPTVAELARHGIHLHFYGDFTQGPVARVDSEGPGAGAGTPAPAPERRPRRMGARIFPVRRRLAARVSQPERRRHPARRLGRPEHPGAGRHPGRGRAADDSVRQRRRHRGGAGAGAAPRYRAVLRQHRRPGAPAARLRGHGRAARARLAGARRVLFRRARARPNGFLRARHRPCRQAGPGAGGHGLAHRAKAST
ncbi:hypothetical protein MasN3_33440 [Massilia varians]|uniref:Glycosyltransferase 2-like domain-containing protein n=1 Tax=Massilia varians TaxID=457921 RepID=A0ABM8C9D4_9BURK|nr:glycosyltransferase family A protein [Massilia varians]BDT59850.1 hypothetical protein MasN3_33440 [Massilia varians]